MREVQKESEEVKMNIKVFTITILFALLLVPLTAQREALAKLTPAQSAQAVEKTLEFEGHPCRIVAKKVGSAWDFEIDLERDYDGMDEAKMLLTLTGAITTATRYVRWASNRIYLKKSGVKYAWIKISDCWDIVLRVKMGELSGNVRRAKTMVALFMIVHDLRK